MESRLLLLLLSESLFALDVECEELDVGRAVEEVVDGAAEAPGVAGSLRLTDEFWDAIVVVDEILSVILRKIGGPGARPREVIASDSRD
jgi:hypothetical protein